MVKTHLLRKPGLFGPGIIYFIVFCVSWLCGMAMDGAREAMSLDVQDMGRLGEITLDVLDWDRNNLSFAAKMCTTTYVSVNQVVLDGTIAKLGLRKLRVDLRPMLEGGTDSTQDVSEPLRLGEYTTIYDFERDEAFVLFPAMKAYLVVTKDRADAWITKATRRLDLKTSNVRVTSRESLGSEELEGHPCEKFLFGITTENNVQGRVLCWLARDLNRFPVRSEIETEGRTGETIRTVTEFREIRKEVPPSNLFEVPEGFRRYRTLGEMRRRSKIPKILKIPKKR